MDRDLLRGSIEKNTTFSFSRSSGKGGQNVNKVNTKVHAELPVSALEGLSEAEINALKAKCAVNAEGALFIDVQDERTQERNRQIALMRLEKKIALCARVQKKRKKTRPSRQSNERRLTSKKLRSLVKLQRSSARR
jgi:ribosome-associated protein